MCSQVSSGVPALPHPVLWAEPGLDTSEEQGPPGRALKPSWGLRVFNRQDQMWGCCACQRQWLRSVRSCWLIYGFTLMRCYHSINVIHPRLLQLSSTSGLNLSLLWPKKVKNWSPSHPLTPRVHPSFSLPFLFCLRSHPAFSLALQKLQETLREDFRNYPESSCPHFTDGGTEFQEEPALACHITILTEWLGDV